MSAIRKHADRSRTPESRRAARSKRADRVQRERLANAAERAFLRLIEGQAR